jgi:hypothetical protein
VVKVAKAEFETPHVGHGSTAADQSEAVTVRNSEVARKRTKLSRFGPDALGPEAAVIATQQFCVRPSGSVTSSPPSGVIEIS